ncbi:MAG: cell division protein ZapA [Clostridia bacterium]|nr:cell division protein ZapA [Clostridia bacterium]
MSVAEKKEAQQSNKVSVTILNEEFTIRGNAEIGQMVRVAAYVDSKMRELTLKCPYLTPKQVAVLSAVNITNEFFRLKEDYEALIKVLDEDKSI